MVPVPGTGPVTTRVRSRLVGGCGDMRHRAHATRLVGRRYERSLPSATGSETTFTEVDASPLAAMHRPKPSMLYRGYVKLSTDRLPVTTRLLQSLVAPPLAISSSCSASAGHRRTFTTSRQARVSACLPLLRSLAGRLVAATGSEMTFTEVDGAAPLAQLHPPKHSQVTSGSIISYGSSSRQARLWRAFLLGRPSSSCARNRAQRRTFVTSRPMSARARGHPPLLHSLTGRLQAAMAQK